MKFGRFLRKSLVLLAFSPFLCGCSSEVTTAEPVREFIQERTDSLELEKLRLKEKEVEELKARVELYKQRAEKKEEEYLDIQRDYDKIYRILYERDKKFRFGRGLINTQTLEIIDLEKKIKEREHEMGIYERVLGANGFEFPKLLLQNPNLKPSKLGVLEAKHESEKALLQRWNYQLKSDNDKLRVIEQRASNYIKSIGGNVVKVLYDPIGLTPVSPDQ